jgi:hypothetical protein
MPDTPDTQAKPKATKPRRRRGDFDYEQAMQQGYIGSVASEPPNEAYQVDADHAATARAEYEARKAQRDEHEAASRE